MAKQNSELLLQKEQLSNKKFMTRLYRELSVDTGSVLHYAIDLDLAIKMFGEDAYTFLQHVSTITRTGYTGRFNNNEYVGVEGFDLMMAYRANEVYEDEFMKKRGGTKNDSSERKADQQQCDRGKTKEV